MATTGFIPAGSTADTSDLADWSSRDNLLASDGSEAQAGGNTAGVLLKGFNFAAAGLTSGHTVTAVNVRIIARDSFGDGGWPLNVEWAVTASTASSSFTGTVTRFPPTSGDFTAGSGSTAVTRTQLIDGTLPTATELLDANFTLLLQRGSGPDSAETRADYVAIEVVYTTAGDTTAPTYSSNPASDSVSGNDVTCVATAADETDSTVNHYAVLVANAASAPSAAQIKAGQDSTGSAAIDSGSDLAVANGVEASILLTGAAASTAYDVYWTVEDQSGNLAAAQKIDVTTGAAAPTITDIDTDEVVTSDQTGVAVTITDGGTTNADRAFTFEQGTNSVAQTETGTGTSTAAALSMVLGNCKFGAATLRCTRTSDSAFGELSVTVNQPASELFVNVGTPNTTASNRITAVADIETGDQLHARGVGGGAVPTGLSLNADATFEFSVGNTPAAFDVRIWDVNDETWGSFATQSVAADVTVDADLVAAEWAANAATVSLLITVDADTSAAVFSPSQADITLSKTVTADAAPIEATGLAATVETGSTIAVGLASIAATARQAVITLAKTVSAAAASIAATANAATVAITNFISASTAQAAFATYPASITSAVELRRRRMWFGGYFHSGRF